MSEKIKNQLSYSSAFSRLEKIQNLIEGNTLDVDELADKLKEASSLLKVCREKLFTANEETRKILEELK